MQHPLESQQSNPSCSHNGMKSCHTLCISPGNNFETVREVPKKRKENQQNSYQKKKLDQCTYGPDLSDASMTMIMLKWDKFHTEGVNRQ